MIILFIIWYKIILENIFHNFQHILYYVMSFSQIAFCTFSKLMKIYKIT